MTTADQLQDIEHDAKTLRVPMTHVARDPEYASVLTYRIDQEIARAEHRIEELRSLRMRVENVSVV